VSKWRFVGSRCAASGERSTANPSSRGPVKQRASCPGRGAAFFTLLRRAGTHGDAECTMGPGSAAHHAAKCGALRSIRGTHSSSSPQDATSRPRGAMRPSRCIYLSPRKTKGVGNAGCPLHPRSRVHLVVVKRTRVTTSTPESPGIPARNGFNGFLRALPGDRALLPPSSADMFCLSPVGPTQLRELDASVGASGPHDFAVRCNISRPPAW
jgi:hypothetical protein